jgi:hypothetical protein
MSNFFVRQYFKQCINQLISNNKLLKFTLYFFSNSPKEVNNIYLSKKLGEKFGMSN